LIQRERRYQNQKFLLQDGSCLISFTLNVPGSTKRFDLADRAFWSGLHLILQMLSDAGCPILIQHISDVSTGLEGLVLVEADPIEVKRLMIQIEISSPIGRFFDIDVLNQEGGKVTRTALGEKRRSCFLCDKDAIVCAHNRTHTIAELSRYVHLSLEQYFCQEDSEFISAIAQRALLTEVAISPKPGLVDRRNTGAHCDMDFFTFLNSSVALRPWFRSFAAAGIQSRSSSFETLFHQLRFLGKQAEKCMLAATDGVNTHKGAIFSLGILCGAMGRIPTPKALLKTCAQIASFSLLDFYSLTAPQTHGEFLYLSSGITGIRGEAAAGFPSVQKYGLPSLIKVLHHGFSLNDAGLISLLSLMSHVTDTTVLSRGDKESGEFVRQEATRLHAHFWKNPAAIHELEDVDRYFSQHNLSPGGCADLLALTLMLYFSIPPHILESEDLQEAT